MGTTEQPGSSIALTVAARKAKEQQYAIKLKAARKRADAIDDWDGWWHQLRQFLHDLGIERDEATKETIDKVSCVLRAIVKMTKQDEHLPVTFTSIREAQKKRIVQLSQTDGTSAACYAKFQLANLPEVCNLLDLLMAADARAVKPLKAAIRTLAPYGTELSREVFWTQTEIDGRYNQRGGEYWPPDRIATSEPVEKAIQDFGLLERLLETEKLSALPVRETVIRLLGHDWGTCSVVVGIHNSGEVPERLQMLAGKCAGHLGRIYRHASQPELEVSVVTCRAAFVTFANELAAHVVACREAEQQKRQDESSKNYDPVEEAKQNFLVYHVLEPSNYSLRQWYDAGCPLDNIPPIDDPKFQQLVAELRFQVKLASERTTEAEKNKPKLPPVGGPNENTTYDGAGNTPIDRQIRVLKRDKKIAIGDVKHHVDDPVTLDVFTLLIETKDRHSTTQIRQRCPDIEDSFNITKWRSSLIPELKIVLDTTQNGTRILPAFL